MITQAEVARAVRGAVDAALSRGYRLTGLKVTLADGKATVEATAESVQPSPAGGPPLVKTLQEKLRARATRRA